MKLIVLTTLAVACVLALPGCAPPTEPPDEMPAAAPPNAPSPTPPSILGLPRRPPSAKPCLAHEATRRLKLRSFRALETLIEPAQIIAWADRS